MPAVLTTSPSHRAAGPARSRRVGALHVFGLSAFAFAQPLYEVLGANPAFFVAHRATPLDILAFVAFLSLLLPAVLVAIAALLAAMGPRLARAWHLGVVWGLASIVAMPILARAGFGDTSSLGLALLLATLATLAYASAAAIRSFVTVLSIAAIAFPAMFLMRSEMRGLWLPHRVLDAAAAGSTARAIPVVMVVFDELSLHALLDAQGQIDAARYPAFGRLAATSYWFRNATTVSDSTVGSVPALLTGQFPTESERPPTAAGHPGNLFTLLSATHDLHVTETVTELCPSTLCSRARDPFGRRMTFLISDAAVVFLHWCLPDGIRAGLPSIAGRWAGFGADAGPATPGPHETQDILDHILRLVRQDRQETFQRFVASIDPPGRPPLHFLHVLLPHTPYEYLPSGRTFATNRFRNVNVTGDRLTDEPEVLTAAYRRYLLQLQHVDGLLGTLWARLDRQGLFDNSLIVVTSDHGVSYRPGGDRRVLTDASLADVLPVPLFVKLPGQTEGTVSDRTAELIDVLPTMTDVLGVQPSWAPDGSSLLGDQSILRSTKRARRTNDGVVFEYPATDVLLPSHQASVEMFGQGADLRPLFATPGHAELIGTPVNRWTVGRANATVEIDDPLRFAEVRLSSTRVPADVTGRLRGVAPDTAEIAVVINGTVAGVGPVFRDGDGAPAFEALVSDEFLVEGLNTLEIFTLARDADGGHRLSRVPAPFDPAKLRFDADRLTMGDDSIVRLGNSIRSYLDQITSDERDVVLTGWAFREDGRAPAEQILLFSGESIVASTRISLERPDVADHFQNPKVLHSGYSLRVPIDRWRDALRDTVTLVATAGDLGAHVPWAPRYTECQVRRIGLPGRTDGTMIRMARDALPAPAVLTLEGERTAQVVDGAATGYVESLAEADGCASISGWALDATRPEAPVTVLVVQDGAIVQRTRAVFARPDVASAHGLTHAGAGFAFAMTPDGRGKPAREVRVYAVTEAGTATELRYLWHTRTPR